MGLTKIQNEQEIIRWFGEGRTYRWMVDEYARKYGIAVGTSMFGNFRRRRGLDRRITRDDDLIPWEVELEHRWSWDIQMLRLEARDRAGIRSLSGEERHRLMAWKQGLERDGLVVDYDPTTIRGFLRVSREANDDDLIRRPRCRTTRQPNRDK